MKANKLTPNFEVTDIIQTVKFYQETLGFNLIMAVPETQDGIDQAFSEEKEYVYALVSKDNVELMFQRTDTFKADVVFSKGFPIGASVSFYLEVDGVGNLYQEIKDKGIMATELKTAWYGMKEFYMQDNNGYILGIAEKA
ncbi:VOC family protein [Dyadobacter sp.]|uniref:VOC family protein n=1 Tax=Dyadobacter sp. TaxID=1914288 RepID=UPI003F6FC5EE